MPEGQLHWNLAGLRLVCVVVLGLSAGALSVATAVSADEPTAQETPAATASSDGGQAAPETAAPQAPAPAESASAPVAPALSVPPATEASDPAPEGTKPESTAKDNSQHKSAEDTSDHGPESHGKASTTNHAEAGATANSHGASDHGHEAGHEGDHGGHGHHDPYDLSHQNATPKLSQVDELKGDLALWSFVVFLLLLAVLTKFAWGPIMKGLHTREESIAAMIDDAKASSEKASELLRQYEAKLAAATDEINDLRTQARKDAEATKERILAEARDASQRERERAIADIGIAKTAALQEITEKSVDLAVILAGRLIRRQLTTEDRAGLVREALDQLPSRN